MGRSGNPSGGTLAQPTRTIRGAHRLRSNLPTIPANSQSPRTPPLCGSISSSHSHTFSVSSSSPPDQTKCQPALVQLRFIFVIPSSPRQPLTPSISTKTSPSYKQPSCLAAQCTPRNHLSLCQNYPSVWGSTYGRYLLAVRGGHFDLRGVHYSPTLLYDRA